MLWNHFKVIILEMFKNSLFNFNVEKWRDWILLAEVFNITIKQVMRSDFLLLRLSWDKQLMLRIRQVGIDLLCKTNFWGLRHEVFFNPRLCWSRDVYRADAFFVAYSFAIRSLSFSASFFSILELCGLCREISAEFGFSQWFIFLMFGRFRLLLWYYHFNCFNFYCLFWFINCRPQMFRFGRDDCLTLAYIREKLLFVFFSFLNSSGNTWLLLIFHRSEVTFVRFWLMVFGCLKIVLNTFLIGLILNSSLCLIALMPNAATRIFRNRCYHFLKVSVIKAVWLVHVRVCCLTNKASILPREAIIDTWFCFSSIDNKWSTILFNESMRRLCVLSLPVIHPTWLACRISQSPLNPELTFMSYRLGSSSTRIMRMRHWSCEYVHNVDLAVVLNVIHADIRLSLIHISEPTRPY